MSKIIQLSEIKDENGSLTVIEKILPFEIKRIYYIYGVNSPEIVRGGHRHKKTLQAAICLSGRCTIECISLGDKSSYNLDSPQKCLLIEPEDWHTMQNFSEGSVLLILASEYYDREDYIDEKY